MAMHHLHLTEPFQSCRIGMSTAASFDGSRLIVEWKGQTKSCPAEVGDLIFVDCWGGFPRFGKTVAPKRLDRLALWLVGVPKEVRKATYDEAVEAYHHAIHRHINDDFEYQIAPRNFQEKYEYPKYFFGYDYQHKYQPYWSPIAAFVDQNITIKEVGSLVEKVGSRWAPEVVEKFLAEDA